MRLECITFPTVSLDQNAPVYNPHSVLTLPRASFRLNVLLYYSRECINLPLVSFGQNIPLYCPPGVLLQCHLTKIFHCVIRLQHYYILIVSFGQKSHCIFRIVLLPCI